jgi:hypothetical protein
MRNGLRVVPAYPQLPQPWGDGDAIEVGPRRWVWASGIIAAMVMALAVWAGTSGATVKNLTSPLFFVDTVTQGAHTLPSVPFAITYVQNGDVHTVHVNAPFWSTETFKGKNNTTTVVWPGVTEITASTSAHVEIACGYEVNHKDGRATNHISTIAQGPGTVTCEVGS